jgi:hypothetical protein
MEKSGSDDRTYLPGRSRDFAASFPWLRKRNYKQFKQKGLKYSNLSRKKKYILIKKIYIYLEYSNDGVGGVRLRGSYSSACKNLLFAIILSLLSAILSNLSSLALMLTISSVIPYSVNTSTNIIRHSTGRILLFFFVMKGNELFTTSIFGASKHSMTLPGFP